jgi:hypothetical protein
MRTAEKLKITNDRLLIFLDETGHETFAEDHPYYAVGGCVILGAHYESVKAATRDGAKAGARRSDESETYLMVCNFPAVAPGFIAGACGTSMSIRAGRSLAGIGRPK